MIRLIACIWCVGSDCVCGMMTRGGSISRARVAGELRCYDEERYVEALRMVVHRRKDRIFVLRVVSSSPCFFSRFIDR